MSQDDDHDDDQGGGDFFNFTAAGTEGDNSQNMQELTCGPSQEMMDVTTLAGDKLVAQPNRVTQQ